MSVRCDACGYQPCVCCPGCGRQHRRACPPRRMSAEESAEHERFHAEHEQHRAERLSKKKEHKDGDEDA